VQLRQQTLGMFSRSQEHNLLVNGKPRSGAAQLDCVFLTSRTIDIPLAGDIIE